MSRPKPRDLSGTARCSECRASAVYPGGRLGAPLVIFHDPGCPEHPSQREASSGGR